VDIDEASLGLTLEVISLSLEWMKVFLIILEMVFHIGSEGDLKGVLRMVEKVHVTFGDP
jgi:hypothetical protein